MWSDSQKRYILSIVSGLDAGVASELCQVQTLLRDLGLV